MTEGVDWDGVYAHSRNREGVRQELRAHLEAVADLAAEFAEPFAGSGLARAAGLWHDLGKYNPEWQTYLRGAESGQRAAGTGPDHKGTGACFAREHCEPLAPLIAGHHGGLVNRSDVMPRIDEWRKAGAADVLGLVPRDLLAQGYSLDAPGFVNSALGAEFFLRMLFSALVDADFLDTERHFEGERGDVRGGGSSMAALWQDFANSRTALSVTTGEVQRVRSEVYEACLVAADLSTGLFRLTVPTGGGKTLSSMAFALRHALRHDLRRIVVAVPYTSITEQTASVYRSVFRDERSVLEHHSAIEPTHLDAQTEAGMWSRLAAENWDAPIIVTTTVQLFESLFAAGTRRCRKLHRLARSVIILDEAQALPYELLAPILDGLRALAFHYGVSVVLCTATQPALDDAPGFRGLADVRDIVADPAPHFAALRRVRYEFPGQGEPWSWSRVADEMWVSPQSLAILNTVADAQALYAALDDSDAFHLSTRLCGAHRRDVLKTVRARLQSGEDCRLVSTQVVEAGVDLDFPLVLRAMGPLDRIVQAAGRCNREGKLAEGRVVVFQAEEGDMPRGTYRTAADQAAVELARPGTDLHDPEVYQRYFRALFGKLDLDSRGIQALRARSQYDDVAKKFRMIAEDMADVIVPYDERADGLIERLQNGAPPSRYLLRALQPFMVGLRRHSLEQYRRRGLVAELPPSGLLLWLGGYDEKLGLQAESGLLYV